MFIKLQTEAQKAAQEYQRASSLYKTAKETLSLAEHNFVANEIPDAWQEHINSTISRLNTSKKNVDTAEELHRRMTCEFQTAEERCKFLEQDLKRHINKSQLYYDEKNRWTIQMEAQKTRIQDLEKTLHLTKITYKEAMHNLAKISEEIHMKRKNMMPNNNNNSSNNKNHNNTNLISNLSDNNTPNFSPSLSSSQQSSDGALSLEIENRSEFILAESPTES